jgi:hypothetical protein
MIQNSDANWTYHEAEEEGAEDEEEQIPQNLHGYWQKSHVKDSDVQTMEGEGTVAP